MTKNNKLLIPVLLSFIIASTLHGQGKTTVTLTMPLYNSNGQIWLDKQGHLKGFTYDILNMLNKEIETHHIKFEYKMTEQGPLPLSRCIAEILNGKYDAFFGLIYSHKREEDGLKFSSQVLFSVSNALWVRKEDAGKYTSLNSLKGKRIGIVNGYPYLTKPEENAGLLIDRTAQTNEANIMKLINGRVDAIIDNKIRTGTAILNMGFEDKIIHCDSCLKPITFYIAYNKDVPNYVIETIDNVLEQLHKKNAFSSHFSFGYLKTLPVYTP